MKIPVIKLTGFSNPEWWAEVYEDQPEAVNVATRRFSARVRAKAAPQPETLGSDDSPVEQVAMADPDAATEYIASLSQTYLLGSTVAWCWDDPVSAASYPKLPHDFVDELLAKLYALHSKDKRAPKEAAALKN